MRGWLGRALFFSCCSVPIACSAVLGIEELPEPKTAATTSRFCAAEQAGAKPHRYCADFDDGLRSLWVGQTREAEGLIVGDPAKTKLEAGEPAEDRHALTNGTTLRLVGAPGATATWNVIVHAKLPMGRVTMLQIVFHTTPEIKLSLWEENFKTAGIQVDRGTGGPPIEVGFAIDNGGIDGSKFQPYQLLVTSDLNVTAFAGGTNVLNDSFADVGPTPVAFDVIVGAVDTTKAQGAEVRVDKLTVDEAVGVRP